MCPSVSLLHKKVLGLFKTNLLRPKISISQFLFKAISKLFDLVLVCDYHHLSTQQPADKSTSVYTQYSIQLCLCKSVYYVSHTEFQDHNDFLLFLSSLPS